MAAAEYLYTGGYYESCISRAYYAAFTAVSVLLETRRQRRRGYISYDRTRRRWHVEASHDMVQEDFLQLISRRGDFTTADGNAYGKLRAARDDADYALEGYRREVTESLLMQGRHLVSKIRARVSS